MQTDGPHSEEPSLVSNRTMEVVVALLFLAGAALVIYDSFRLGIGWHEGEGPAPGYFPFRVAVLIAIASVVTLVQVLIGSAKDGDESFVSRIGFGRVLIVLLPAIVYVALICYVGIYVASGLFIFAFMIIFGRENPLLSLVVGVGVPFALFMMFEKWFLVPLPKGPLEAMLGY